MIAPAPAQTPSMAATMGCGQARIALTRSPVMRVKASSPAMSSLHCISTSGPMISWTSPPEQKLPPAPMKTTALMSVGVDQIAKGIAQLGVGFERERILPLRPIERDGRDLAVKLPEKMLG